MILLQRFPEKVVPNKHVVPNNCRGLEAFWKKSQGRGTVIQEWTGYEWMRTVFGCFTIYTYFIKILEFMWFMQKKESVTFNFLGAKFLSCKNGYFHENQLVILIVIGPEIS